MTESKWFSIRLIEKDASIIARASDSQESFSAAGREILANGLRFLMLEAGISRNSILPITTDAIFNEYEKFDDATSTQAGVVGPLGNVYRLEPTPDGSVILHRDEILVNGEIFRKRGE